jgi:hypothetical protein
MSSVQTVIAQSKKNLTKFFSIQTPSYTDSGIELDMPIPFYVTNQGVLEIRIQDNVTEDLLTVGTFVDLTDDPSFQCKVMGGFKPVMSLGDTVKSFLTAYINEDQESSPSGEFELVVKPVMTKVQFSTNPGQLRNSSVHGISNYLPSSSEYVTGQENNVYRTAWVFQSPMTVKFYSTALSRYQYATFSSDLSEE